MTLIVGVRCENAVVVGADSAVTYSADFGPRTIGLPAAKKISIIDGRMAVCISGNVGLGQKVIGELQKLSAEKKLAGKLRPHEMGILLQKHLYDNAYAVEIQIASHAAKTFGEAAHSSAICLFLLALPVEGKPALIAFDKQASPTVTDDGLPPFVSLGSGQLIADPMLAFVRKIFFPNRLPTLEEGLFAAMWTLQHAIETNPGGVSAPICMAKLDASGKAAMIPEGELEGVSEMIRSAESSLRRYRELDTSSPVTAPPKPPTD